MSALFALIATILTSWLPILNKRILRDTRPAQVAWIINAASLPVLAVGTLLLTPCSVPPPRGGMLLSCTAPVPHLAALFGVALPASCALAFPSRLLPTLARPQPSAASAGRPLISHHA